MPAHFGKILANAILVMKVVIAEGLLQINFLHMDAVMGIKRKDDPSDEHHH